MLQPTLKPHLWRRQVSYPYERHVERCWIKYKRVEIEYYCQVLNFKWKSGDWILLLRHWISIFLTFVQLINWPSDDILCLHLTFLTIKKVILCHNNSNQSVVFVVVWKFEEGVASSNVVLVIRPGIKITRFVLK